MTKIALLGDTHFGIKKSSNEFLKSQETFFKDELVPNLKKNKIEKIFILGDLFDNRNHTNTKTQNLVQHIFTEYLKDFEIVVIMGNHDLYYNNIAITHSIKWLSLIKNVTVIDTFQEMKVYDENIFLIPWQVDNEKLLNHFKENKIKSKICFGHLNLSSFFFNKFKVSDTGMSPQIFFDLFEKTFSGHFHIRNKKKQNNSEIIYIGSPYQLTRNDMNEEKGFVLFDVKSKEYEYINTEKTIKYILLNYPEKITESLIKNNIVDVNVIYDKNYNEYKVQKYLNKIEKYKPIQQPAINLSSNINNMTNVNIEDCDIKSSDELMREYVSMNEEIKNKDEINEKLNELHEQCRKDI